jgi:hypothetical protein
VNSKKVGQVLLSIALVLIVVVGVIEFVERKSKSNEANLCKNKPVATKWAADEMVVWVTRQLVVSIDNKKGILRKYNWHVENEQLVAQVVAEVKLFCDQPGYNCFMPQLRDDKLDWQLLYFKPPFGVARVKYGKMEKSYPFYWDGQQDVKVGAPIQVCGNPLNKSRFEMAVIASRLFTYEEQNHLLANFDFSAMNGASPMSAAHEPEDLMMVTSAGRLNPATCQDARPSTQSLFWIPNADSFVFLSPKDSVTLYRFDKALSRVQLDIQQPDWVIKGPAGFVVISKDSISRISNGEKVVKQMPGIGDLFPKNTWNGNHFVWDDVNRIGTVDPHRWLSTQDMKIIEVGADVSKTEHLNKGFDWSSRTDAFNAVVSSDNKMLYHWQQSQNGDLSVDAVSCQ